MKAASEAEGTQPKPNDLGVLVIEDDAIVTRALGILLRDAGYRPTIYHAGLPALEYALHNTPDAVILDIHLPDISGLVLSQRMREKFGPNVPIIVLSGDTSMENLNALPLVGATYFFSKPVNSIQLLDRLHDLTSVENTK